MFSAYSVLPKEVLLDEYRQEIDYYREMAAEAAEGRGEDDYDILMELAGTLEKVLETAQEAVKTGQAHFIDYDSNRVVNNIYAFSVRPDGKVRCWTQMIGDTYDVVDSESWSKDSCEQLLPDGILDAKKQYEEVMECEDAPESARQHAAIDLNIAEVEYNTAIQAMKEGVGVGYVMLDGDMVFEIKCTLVKGEFVKIEKKNLYTEYFKN